MVKRFDPTLRWAGHGMLLADVVRRDDGEFVRHSDYAALSAKLEEAERFTERTKLHMSAWEDSARRNKHRAEAAEARVAELEKALEPFAAVASAFSFAIGPDGIDDDMTVIAYPHVQPKREVVLSTRNFSDARAALSATKEPKP